MRRRAGELGEDDVAEAGVHHEVEALTGGDAEQQRVELRLHAFDGDPRDLAGHRGHGLAHAGADVEPELCDEPAGPEHPQRVVVERRLRGGGGVEDPGLEVVEAAERVVEDVLADGESSRAMALQRKSRRTRSPSRVSP